MPKLPERGWTPLAWFPGGCRGSRLTGAIRNDDLLTGVWIGGLSLLLTFWTWRSWATRWTAATAFRFSTFTCFAFWALLPFSTDGTRLKLTFGATAWSTAAITASATTLLAFAIAALSVALAITRAATLRLGAWKWREVFHSKVLLTFLLNSGWSFFVFVQRKDNHALQVMRLGSDDFERVENVVEFVTFEFQRLAHGGRKFLRGFSRGEKLFLCLNGVLQRAGVKFGNGSHDLMIIAAGIEVQVSKSTGELIRQSPGLDPRRSLSVQFWRRCLAATWA